MISILSISALLAALPSVDPAVHDLPPCRLESVSFRLRHEAWVTTTCGTVFRSLDRGRSWERELRIEKSFRPPNGGDRFLGGNLNFVRWLNETEGFAGGYIGARVLRTADGGKTWSDARLPGDPMIYSVFTRGDSAWVCGSSGEIFRSDDRAKPWSRVPSPFDSDDRCWSLSFDATRKGEASGMNGSRWVTDNDGATWTVVEAAKGPDAERTNVPGSQSDRVAQHGQATITLDGQLLVFDEPGKPRRAHPLLSKPSGESTPLLGVATRASGQLGWTAKALFFSDDNETWYSVSALPAVPTRLTYLNKKTIVLEGRAGVFRSDTGGLDWKRSEQPDFDHSDAEQATTKVFARNPIACVATALRADLGIRLIIDGCGGGSETQVMATVRKGIIRLGAGVPTTIIEPSKVDAAALRKLVDNLGTRITKMEVPSHCSSTTTHSVEITWSCDESTPKRLWLETNDCGGPEPGVRGSTRSLNGTEPGYSRALAIHELLDQSGSSPK